MSDDMWPEQPAKVKKADIKYQSNAKWSKQAILSLDEKLREIVGAIVYDGYKNGPTTPVEPWVVNLKQAFAEAGWTKLTAMPTATEIAMFESIRAKYPKYMTGQEWLDRFEKELKGVPVPYNDDNGRNAIVVTMDICIEAAKRAAGVENV